MSIPEPRISFATENAILLQFAEPLLNNVELSLQRRLATLVRALREHQEISHLLEDIVMGPGSILLVLYDSHKARRALRVAEDCWQHCDDFSDPPPRQIQIPVCYGGEYGPDLEALSQHLKLDTTEIIQRHSQGNYVVLCLGFLAGFPYLSGLTPSLHCPRKPTPASRIPAGSIAIGGGNTGIYPSASPGGWHIIGRTRLCLFDPHREQPALLHPGDEIEFVAVPSLDDDPGEGNA